MRRALAFGLAIVVVSCTAGPDRADVVSAVADGALVPQVTNAEESLGRLSDAVHGFCEAPSGSSLAEAQAAWATADAAWERAEIVTYFGPAPMLRTESKVDFEPASTAGIDDLLATDTVIDFDYVDNRSAASRRGLGAIEYVLFRPGAEAPDGRACDLATSAAEVAATAAAALTAAWTAGADPFVSMFTTTMTSNEAIADVVGAQVEILTRQTLFELGKALGVTATGPDPAALIEGPAGTGAARLVAQLSGIEEAISAGGEQSLIELIRSRSGEVATEIETLLAGAIADLEAVHGPLSAATVDGPESMLALLDDLSRLRDLIEVDVVSMLDLTLGFSDSDGDTG